MRTIVVDINCLLQIVPKRSPHRWLYDMILRGNISLAISSEILLEYREIFEQKTNAVVAENIIEALTELPDTKNISPSYRWQLITDDPDDDKYVDCAVAANADYLISDDRHFNVLHTTSFPSISRLRLDQTAKLLTDL